MYTETPLHPTAPLPQLPGGRPSTEGTLALVIDPHALSGRGRGLLVTAAANITPELMNRMIHAGRGISVLLVDVQTAFELGLRDMPMTTSTRPRLKETPRYLCSIEAVSGVTTGISAEDRAQTIRMAGRANASPEHFVSPGHVMPLLVPSDPNREGTLHKSALELVKATSDSRAAAACDVLDDDGDTASLQKCLQIARERGYPVVVAA
jgi:3,4-dihydroxy 2-butanone 4-phosphate synthase / GTP cyclohydrolase II